MAKFGESFYHDESKVNISRVRSTKKSKLDQTMDDGSEQGLDKEIQKLELYQKMIKRPELPMDHELKFTEEEFNKPIDEAARWAKDN